LLGNKSFSLDEDLALLSDAATKAGQIALSFFGRSPQVWMKSGDKSPVSEADFAVDAYLKKVLLQARPHYGWISEESVDPRHGISSSRCFVVDPIDGTRGFINGSSQWCVSVAIIEEGQPICGVLECPVTQEHYSAHCESVAMLNNTALLPPADVHKDNQMRISGSILKTQAWPQNLRERLEFVPPIPSLAYRLALIAADRLDIVVVRPNSHDWDLAAADIILRQNGFNLFTLNSQSIHYGQPPFSHGLLLAGKPHIHNQIAPMFK